MNMIIRYLELIIITLFCCEETSSFVFEDEGKSYRGQMSQNSRAAPVERRPASSYSSRITPSTIDSIFQIPLALIQSTSSAAQSVSPNNANAINQFVDIPVKTLQAVGNLVRDMIPLQQSDSQADSQADSQQDESLDRLMKIREQQLQQQLQLQQQQQQLQILQNQPQQDDHSAHRRHIFDFGGWASAFKDLFFGKFGYQGGGGYGNLFENNVYYVNGGAGGGRPEQSYHGHKKGKKKKKRKHGRHGGHEGAQYYDEDYDDYIDNIQPLGIFSWQPSRISGRIQNKIAPGFNDQSRITF